MNQHIAAQRGAHHAALHGAQNKAVPGPAEGSLP
jgi:hypothetical protein